MNARQQWYALSGMSLNIQKTALIGFGFTPDNLNFENFTIEPVTSIKFLGFIIQDDLGLNQQVKAIANKIRTAASNIRSEGSNFSQKNHKIMYMGWVQGALCCNATAYLPLLTATQQDNIQTACNAAIRSVAKLPRKSADISISTTRKELDIMSVQNIADKQILMQAWKDRDRFRKTDVHGPMTRACSNGNIPQPVQKGIFGQIISTLSACAYNKLPLELKMESDRKKAKFMIRNIILCN